MSCLVAQTDRDRIALGRIFQALAKALQRGFDIFRMYKVEASAANQLLRAVAEMASAGLTLINDIPQGVEQRNDVGRLFHKGTKMVFALAQRSLGKQAIGDVATDSQHGDSAAAIPEHFGTNLDGAAHSIFGHNLRLKRREFLAVTPSCLPLTNCRNQIFGNQLENVLR